MKMIRYNNLTNKQNEILIYIKKFIAENNYSPSVREICKGINLNSPATVHTHITNIINKGYLKRNSKNKRLLELLVPNEFKINNNDVINVPLLDKNSTSIDQTTKYFPLPAKLIPNGKEIFTIKASDNSMNKIGILKDDIVIVEKTNIVKNKDIVIAITDEAEITIKTFYKEKNFFRLQPENDLMVPIIFKEINILGKAIGLYREF